jgi:uncharacterized membrane protein YdcZ (DUF606 family)
MTTETFTAIFTLAIFVEALITYFVASPDKTQPWLKYVSASLGVVLCISYNVDLLASLGLVSVYPFVGQVITGLVIGRGSNYLNDLISRIRKPFIATGA